MPLVRRPFPGPYTAVRRFARVSESADDGGLKPPVPRGACGFESHPGHLCDVSRHRSQVSRVTVSSPAEPLRLLKGSSHIVCEVVRRLRVPTFGLGSMRD